MKTAHKAAAAVGVGGLIWWLWGRDEEPEQLGVRRRKKKAPVLLTYVRPKTGPQRGGGPEARDQNRSEHLPVDDEAYGNTFCYNPVNKTEAQSRTITKTIRRAGRRLGYEQGKFYGKADLNQRTFQLAYATMRKLCPRMKLPPTFDEIDQYAARDQNFAREFEVISTKAYQWLYGSWD